MSLDQKLQRALQFANHATQDRKDAQAAFLACLTKEENAAKEALAIALQIAGGTP